MMVRSYANQRPNPALTRAHTAQEQRSIYAGTAQAKGPAQHINSEISFRTVIAIQNLLILKGFLQIRNYRKANPRHKAAKTIFTQS